MSGESASEHIKRLREQEVVSAVANAGGLSEIFSTPIGPTNSEREEHLPIFRRVLAVIVVAIVSTIAGGIWVFQEAFAAGSGVTPSGSSTPAVPVCEGGPADRSGPG